MTMCFWVYNICGSKRYSNNITEDGTRANGSVLLEGSYISDEVLLIQVRL